MILSLRLLVGEMAEKGDSSPTDQSKGGHVAKTGRITRARQKNRLVLSIVEEFALEILQLVLQLIDYVNNPGCWTA